MGESAADYFGALFTNAEACGFEVPRGEIIEDVPATELVTDVPAVGPSATFFDELRFNLERQGVSLPAAAMPTVHGASSLALRHF